MNETHVRREIFGLMRRLWLWPITQTDAALCPHGHLVRPPRGRPDILVLSPWCIGTVVEVKMFPRSGAFSFSRIDESQRRWLNNWTADHGNAFLALGTRTGRAGSRADPRHLWLVPWEDWLRVEKTCVKLSQLSLPLELHRARRRDLRDAGVSAVNLLETWALVWRKGCWHLGKAHPLNAILLHYRGERDLGEESERWKNGAQAVRTLKLSSVAALAGSGIASTNNSPTDR